MHHSVAKLVELTWADRAARVLQVANNLDIFSVISGKRLSADDISARVRGQPEMMEKLLIACAAMGLLKKTGAKYSNTELAQTYLVEGRPLYQGDIIAHAAYVRQFWNTLDEQVILDAGHRDRKHDEHRSFVMGMHNIAAVGRARMFTDAVNLSGRRRFLDVGGGPGSYSIAACKLYPELTAVVFDIPETAAIAREVIAREGLQDRVSVREGDWDTDTFGENNDVVLLSNVLHGPASKAQMKLKKAHDSLVTGGLVVIQEFLLNNEKTGPLIPALFNIMVGAYSESELLSIVTKERFLEPKVVANSEEIGCSWITAEKR
ncbi:MAG: methyltransferase [Planctomycetota bacterium]|jgi:SAM-dependent methyltransferase